MQRREQHAVDSPGERPAVPIVVKIILLHVPMLSLQAARVDSDDDQSGVALVVAKLAQRRQWIFSVDCEHGYRPAQLARKQDRVDSELDARCAEKRHRFR